MAGITIEKSKQIAFIKEVSNNTQYIAKVICPSAFQVGTKNSNANTVIYGTVSATGGLSGSLTHLVDGNSYIVAGSNITVVSQSNGAVTISASGGGAPTDAKYVTLSTNSTLSDERVLTAGTGIDLTDGGAGSTATLSVDVSDFMTNGTNNYIVTATGADAMNAEANMTFDGTNLLVSDDTTGYANIGKARVGGSSVYTTHAYFSHRDQTSAGEYALLQNSSGNTFLNAASGEPIYFRINNSTGMTLNSAKNVGINTISPQSMVHIKQSSDPSYVSTTVTNNGSAYD